MRRWHFLLGILAAAVPSAAADVDAASVGIPMVDGVPWQPSALDLLQPTRLADTRSEVGYTRLDDSTIRVQIAGRGGVDSAALAATVTLTAVATSGSGYVTAWPSGSARSEVSNLNYGPGETRANTAIVTLGNSGSIDVHTSVVADLLVDVVGAFVPPVSIEAGFLVPVEPRRAVDTRVAPLIPIPHTSTAYMLGSSALGEPSPEYVGVAVNITVTNTDGPGFVSICNCKEEPSTSILNVDAADQTRAVFTILPPAAVILVTMEADLIIDVVGRFVRGSVGRASGAYVPLPPRRLVDTRPSPIDSASSTTLPPLPTDAIAIAANFTMVDPAGPGYLSSKPVGSPIVTSTVNASRAGEVVANFGITPSPTAVEVVAGETSTDVLVDLAGYFTDGSPSMNAIVVDDVTAEGVAVINQPGNRPYGPIQPCDLLAERALQHAASNAMFGRAGPAPDGLSPVKWAEHVGLLGSPPGQPPWVEARILILSPGAAVADAVTTYGQSPYNLSLQGVAYVGIAKALVPGAAVEYWAFYVLMRTESPELCQS